MTEAARPLRVLHLSALQLWAMLTNRTGGQQRDSTIGGSPDVQ